MKFSLLLLFLSTPLAASNTSSDIYKDHDRSWNDGSHPSLSAAVLSQLSPGMSRRQVRELMGTPHFNEGIIVRNWHYLVNISVNGQTVAKDCQVRIDFFEGRVKQIRWQKPDCAQQVK